MIIKQWSGSAFVELHPKTLAQLVYTNNSSATIFDSNDKIKPAYLPDSVFDSLQFMTTLVTGNLNETMGTPIEAMYGMNRSKIGLYFVAPSAITLTLSATATAQGTGPAYYANKCLVRNIDSSTYLNSGTVEMQAGDWLVITSASGAGTTADPYIFNMDIVNNAYETATATKPGIIALGSSATTAISGKTYGVHSAGGQLAVTVPWTDNQLDNAGVIAKVLTGLSTTTGGAVAATDSILAAFGKLEKRVALNDAKVTNVTYTLPLAASGTRGGVQIGYTLSGKNYPVELSSEKMYVNVPWTDNNTTYSATALRGLELTGTGFGMVHPFFAQESAPATPVPGTVWFDI